MAACVFALGQPMARAGESTVGDYFHGVGANLGRGLENVLTSLAEIPCTMRTEMADRTAWPGTATGFGKGMAYFGRRLLVGVSEILTFILPAPRTLPRVCTEPAPV